MTENLTFLEKLSSVGSGMSRADVLRILDPCTRSLTPEGFEPIADSFLYTDINDEERFAHVWYKSGKVKNTTVGNTSTAGIAV